MDPYDRYEGFGRPRRARPEAILVFVVGVLVAYVLQFSMRLGGGGLFTVLIVLAVGGLWYHIRRIV